MHLLYLTFGSNIAVHTQASFSIYSFLRENEKANTINVVTDQPAFYTHFVEKVNVIHIGPAELKSWEGLHQFFWRVKIKAIELVCTLYPGEPIVYLDSDTFLINGFATLQQNLLEGNAYMHENEGQLSKKKSKTERLMWQQLQHKKFGGIPMQPADCMWNAGVVATPNTQLGEECRLALTICDEMCQQGVTRRLVEQYALSLALQHMYGLQEARQQVAHYWQVKPLWNESITSFFLKAYCQQCTFKETLEQIKVYNFTALPIALRTKKTNLRIKKLADRFFPAQNPVYLQLPGAPL